jgi:hypothetical protein
MAFGELDWIFGHVKSAESEAYLYVKLDYSKLLLAL